MRILISLVLVVCLIFGGVAVAAECDDVLYDCPIYANTYSEAHDLPVYSADYAAEPDVDWVPTYLIGLFPDAPIVPARLLFQR
jgi:hypothetical protein